MGRYTLVGLFLGPEKQSPNHTAYFSIFSQQQKVQPCRPSTTPGNVSLEVLEDYFKQYASISYLLSCSPNK